MSSIETSALRRFSRLWETWQGIEGGALVAEGEKIVPRSIFDFERRYVRAAGIAGEVLFVEGREVILDHQDLASDLEHRLTLMEKLAERHPRFRVKAETLDKVRALTDKVLGDIGFPDGEVTPTPVVEFNVRNPDMPRRGLKIYSIAEAVGGYNTYVRPIRPQDDNSRRWHFIHNGPSQHWDPRADPSIGTIGTVYEHGSYEPYQEFIGWHPPQSDTSVIEGLVADFCDNNPNGTVVVNLHRKMGGVRGVEFGPIRLHQDELV
jgi:hypothetical protein